MAVLFSSYFERFVVLYCSDFFFFQAEDGIRDDLVTGVQTCALPIWTGENPISREGDDLRRSPLGEMKRRALAAWQPIVVLVEALVEAEAAVEHERADERTGAITRTLEHAGERPHVLVQPESSIAVDAVAT